MKDTRRTFQKLSRQISLEHHLNSYSNLMNQICKTPRISQFLSQNHVNNQMVRRSASKIYEYFNEIKKIKSGQECSIPGYFPKLIMNGRLVDVTYVPSKQTLRNRRRLQIHDNLKLIGESDLVRHNHLKHFYTKDGQHLNESRVNILPMISKFMDRYFATSRQYQKGIYLHGDTGRGKTFLLSAIANDLANHGVKVILMHFPTFAIKIKSSIKRDDTLSIINQIEQCPILMLDDLGADLLSTWIRDDVLSIILEYRMQNRLTTFFSSNYSMETLESYLANNRDGSSEPLKAKRIMSRIKFLAVEYELKGKDYRNP